jgi:hypothetical protein
MTGYNGGQKDLEQRRYTRRTKKDRRDMVRWEPEKGERRRDHGRRSSDSPIRRG